VSALGLLLSDAHLFCTNSSLRAVQTNTYVSLRRGHSSRQCDVHEAMLVLLGGQQLQDFGVRDDNQFAGSQALSVRLTERLVVSGSTG
jgi:hypothetical protein